MSPAIRRNLDRAAFVVLLVAVMLAALLMVAAPEIAP